MPIIVRIKSMVLVPVSSVQFSPHYDQFCASQGQKFDVFDDDVDSGQTASSSITMAYVHFTSFVGKSVLLPLETIPCRKLQQVQATISGIQKHILVYW